MTMNVHPQEIKAVKSQVDANDLMVKVAKSWGWKNPPSLVLEIAKKALKLRHMKSGEILIAMNLITKEGLDKLLQEQKLLQDQAKLASARAQDPQKIGETRLLELSASRNPKIRPHIDVILCLKSGHPYYEQFENLLVIHPVMELPSVVEVCSKLEAVLMRTVENTNVLVFSSNQHRTPYNTASAANKQQDPIRIALANFEFDKERDHEKPEISKVSLTAEKVTLYTALGERVQVIQQLEKSKTNQTVETSVDSASAEYIWVGDNAANESQKILARMFDSAMKNKATDIAITPLREGGAGNRMRRFGDLYRMPVARLAEEEYRAIVNFLLVRSQANVSGMRRYAPSDGQMTYRSQSGGDVFLRLNFIPMNHPGVSSDMQSISIRLFPRSETDIRFKDLNYNPKVQEIISMSARFREGLILFCGGTNTGKSTAIAAAIGENIEHYGDSLKRLSMEQPIERFLKGVDQFNVPEEIKLNGKELDPFQLYLRALKRHDPDVIWVGEIRDSITANVCVHAANTGHLVFSTIHANDAFLGYDNLSQEVHRDRRYQLVEALQLVVSQDLVKEICPHCSTVTAPTGLQEAMFKAACKKHGVIGEALPDHIRNPNKLGCVKCDETGYLRVLPINEVLECTQEVKDAMLNILGGHEVVKSKQFIRKSRTFTRFSSAMELVRALKIPLESVVI